MRILLFSGKGGVGKEVLGMARLQALARQMYSGKIDPAGVPRTERSFAAINVTDGTKCGCRCRLPNTSNNQ